MSTWRLLRPISVFLSARTPSIPQALCCRCASTSTAPPRQDRKLDQYGPQLVDDPFAPDPLHKTASQQWPTEADILEATRSQPATLPVTLPSHPSSSPDAAFFQHPLYIPLAQPKTGLGPIIPPLKWPEYDQSVLSAQQSGDYPRDVPMQWTQLRDPYKYWDQQGRRNYGEIMYDHDNYTDFLGIGPEVHWYVPFMGMMKVFGFIALVAFGVAWYDPAANMYFTERDYPYDGLRLELGGDPEDPDDRAQAARRL
ncbi:hypothetical protein SeLEV6574_g06546 [Synchytrium endobioticum]|uniref:NADH dehydrogenase [ubiquinone] 1 beta subcomplex subunit 8, mitochondrial n=1 Tax=Synchytrium endobioticum TaxID=286115 RepID=A0A507CN59_9FUNG|nr:hypothetical protein SeLEV6574_g06546 [Synchytrium endobioticum]